MDAAGKDSAIKHVMRGLDPKATQVFSFKAPSSEELDHDFMWRCLKALPERGRIGVFNRSYYEEVLVVRVHPELLRAAASARRSCITPRIWNRALRGHPRHRALPVPQRHGHPQVLSQRLEGRAAAALPRAARRPGEELEVLDQRRQRAPALEGIHARLRGGDRAPPARATRPWYVIPADNKWFTRLAIAEIDHRDAREPRPALPARSTAASTASC